MAKRQEFRQYRDNYTLKFNDDEQGVVWTTGNLQRVLRNLWNANQILRELNPDRTARDFAIRIGRNMTNRLLKTGGVVAPFYLVPVHAKAQYRNLYAGTITRNVMKAAKVL